MKPSSMPEMKAELLAFVAVTDHPVVPQKFEKPMLPEAMTVAAEYFENAPPLGLLVKMKTFQLISVEVLPARDNKAEPMYGRKPTMIEEFVPAPGV